MDGTRYQHEREVLVRTDGMPVDYVPNANRIVRVAPDYWRRMLRHTCVGIAPGTEDTSDGTPTVLCTYADGTSEVRTVSSFRQTREHRRDRQQDQKLQDSRIASYEARGARLGFNTELAGE